MNRTWLKRLLWVLLFLVLPVLSGAAPVLPVGKVEYDFVYDRLERQEALSCSTYNYQLGPYDANGGRFSFGPFDYLANIAFDKLVLHSSALEDFYSTRSSAPTGFESIRGGIAARPMDRVFVYANFLLDERKAEDAFYTGKKWRGLAGGVEEAFACFRTGRVEVTAGRFASFWGPRNSLVLAPTNALDGLEYSFHWGRLVLSYRLAKLDGLNPEEDGVEQFENRFFAAHRLDVHLSRALRVAAFEAVVYGGAGRQIDLLYLNPIVFFHADQLNEGMDDNTLLGLDFMWRPRIGVKLYGQLLVDDFQIEKDSQGDQEPDQYGALAGLHLVDLVPEFDVKLEYTRVTNWTFNQELPRNRYLLNNDLIGGAPGNDYEQFQMTCSRWLGANSVLSARFTYRLQGEGWVTADWTAPWLDVDGDYDEPFPTGIVEKTRAFSLGLRSFLFNHFFVDMEAGVQLVDNSYHVYGDDRSQPFVGIRLSSFFSQPLSVDW